MDGMTPPHRTPTNSRSTESNSRSPSRKHNRQKPSRESTLLKKILERSESTQGYDLLPEDKEEHRMRIPPPSAAFHSRTRRAELEGGGQETDMQKQKDEAYEEMRNMLSELVARGVAMPSGEWRQESAQKHLQLGLAHCWRALVVAICPVSLRWARKVHGQRRSSTLLKKDDIILTDEEGVPDAASLSKHWLIMPVGTWKEKWDLAIMLCIMYSAVVVPIRVCFDYPAVDWVWYTEVSMTLLFIVDIIFTFNTVYLDPSMGNWVVSRKKIAIAYAKSWLWVDLPSSVPVELLDLVLEGDSTALGLLRILRMFRLLRLLRLLKLDEYIETLENQFEINLRVLRILFMLLKICFLAHILGCFWYAMHHVAGGNEGVRTWATVYDEVNDAHITDESTAVSRRYLISVYWAVTTLTTVGYGDITPMNDAERGYALGSMLCSALVFGYIMSSIGTLAASMDRQAALVEEKTDAVKAYVQWRSLPKDLATRVKKHYSFYYTRRQGFNEVELLDGLSPCLRSEVTRFVLKETLGKLPIFKDLLDPEFQLEVFPLIKPVSYLKGEVVFKRGEVARDLFFLLAGEVSVISSITGKVTTKITPTDEIVMSATNTGEEVMVTKHTGCFGESVLNGRRRPATHIASAWSEMLLLTKTDLLALLEKNPQQARRMLRRLLAEVERKEKLTVLILRFMIGALPARSESRAALVIQKQWKRFVNQMASADEKALASLARSVLVPDSSREHQSVSLHSEGVTPDELLRWTSTRLTEMQNELRAAIYGQGPLPSARSSSSQ